MTKLNMRLNQKDEDSIKVLKERYGITQTSELVHFLITSVAYQIEHDSNVPFNAPIPKSTTSFQ